MADNLSISSWPIQNYQRPGTTAYILFWYSEDIIALDGVTEILGGAVRTGPSYKRVDCTVNQSDHTVTPPTFTLTTTNDSSRPNVRVSAALFDVSGAFVQYLFLNWIIPSQLAPSTTFGVLKAYNDPVPTQPKPRVPSWDLILSVINGILPAPLASLVQYGRVRLSVDPLNAADPVVPGDNDPRIAPAGAVYWASHGTSADDAILGMGTTVPVRLIFSEPMPCTNPIVTPNIQLEFVGNGRLVVGAGFELTIANPPIAAPNQWIIDVSAAGASVEFTGRGTYYPDWLGAIDDPTVDSSEPINVLYLAVPGFSEIKFTGRYGIASTVSFVDRPCVTITTPSGKNSGDSNGPGLFWIGGIGGTMLEYFGNAKCTLRGLAFDANPDDLNQADIAIDVTVGSHVSSENEIAFNGIFSRFSIPANPNFIGIRVSNGTTDNNEFMWIHDNYISPCGETVVSDNTGAITSGTPDLTSTDGAFDVSMEGKVVRIAGAGAAGATLESVISAFINSDSVTIQDNAITTVGPTARIVIGKMVGIGVQTSTSPNVKDTWLERNSIQRALYAYHIQSGHAVIRSLRSGNNECDIRIESNSSEPIDIFDINTENSRQGIYAASVFNLIVHGCRFATLETLSEGVIEIASGTQLATIRENTFQEKLSPGDRFINISGASLNGFVLESNFWPSAGGGIALDTAVGPALRLLNLNSGRIGPQQNINDLFGMYELGYYNTFTFKGNLVANLGTPPNGSMTFATDGLPGSNPLTGGSTGCFAVRQNGAWRGLT